MSEREKIIKQWFDMWLRQDCRGIEEIFDCNAVYIESWGPRYDGLEAVGRWFEEWNTRGTVLKWDIKAFFHSDGQTAVQWYFKNSMADSSSEEFEGMSLIKWTDCNKILYLREYGSNINNYDPYKNGKLPQFTSESCKWF